MTDGKDGGTGTNQYRSCGDNFISVERVVKGRPQGVLGSGFPSLKHTDLN